MSLYKLRRTRDANRDICTFRDHTLQLILQFERIAFCHAQRERTRCWFKQGYCRFRRPGSIAERYEQSLNDDTGPRGIHQGQRDHNEKGDHHQPERTPSLARWHNHFGVHATDEILGTQDSDALQARRAALFAGFVVQKLDRTGEAIVQLGETRFQNLCDMQCRDRLMNGLPDVPKEVASATP